MLPERSQSRPSKGWAIHERKRKAEERREFQPVPTWDTTAKLLELRTHSFYDLSELFTNNRFILKEFYDARYDIAIGKGSTKLNNFTRKYTQNEEAKTYNPELIDQLSPLFTIIRDSFPKNPKK